MSDETGFEVECPHCGAGWALDEKESKEAQFTCGTSFNVQQARIPDEVHGQSQPARLSEIVMIIIRLYAFWIALDGIYYLLTVGAGYRLNRPNIFDFLACAIFAVCALWMWHLAPRIAGWITRENETHLDLGNFLLEDLYCFAFLLVGLYFAVDSLGPSLTWLHYSLLQSSSAAGLSPQQQGNFYTLFKYLVKLILGLALIFKGRTFAAKVMAKQIESSKS